jgi:hypothetical protein
MKNRPTALALASLLLFATFGTPASAGPMAGSKWERPAQSSTGKQRPTALLPGGENANRTNALTSQINWHRSIGQAESNAAQQGKMILWVNLLGTMSGAT